MKTLPNKPIKRLSGSYSFHVSELELTNGLYLCDEELEVEYKLQGVDIEITAVYDGSGTEISAWIPPQKMNAIYQRGYDIPAFID